MDFCIYYTDVHSYRCTTDPLPTRSAGRLTDSNFINRTMIFTKDALTVGRTLPSHNQFLHLLLYDIVMIVCSLYYLLYSVYVSFIT